MNSVMRFFDNDSRFGKIMTRIGTIIVANILFVICSLPVVTFGASWAAMHYTLLKTLREKELNPFSTFWKGLKSNLKQGILVTLGLIALIGFLALEIFWCRQFSAPVSYFQYGLVALLAVIFILGLYIFPVMAAFEASVRQLIFNSLYFAIAQPVSMLLIAAVHVLPLAVTYLDTYRMPLYAFLWVSCGFGLVTLFTDFLLLKQFNPYQAPVDNGEEELSLSMPHQKSDEEILEEMKRMGF